MPTYAETTTGAVTDLYQIVGQVGSVVRALGYHAPRDGGGGGFLWENDTTTADDGGLVIVPDAGPTRTGCWRRIVDTSDGAVSVRWFGARGNGIADDVDAFERAIRCDYHLLFSTVYPAERFAVFTGLTVDIPLGYYLLSRTLVVDRQVTLRGAGLPYDAPISKLACTHTDTALKITRGARLVGLWLAPFVKGGPDQHGLLVQSRVLVERCTVLSFGGNGIELAASIADGTNASGSRVVDSTVQLNGGHGVHLVGGDANVCVVQRCALADNGGWGVCDDGFLGNRFSDNLFHNNALGAFTSTGENARSLHDGAYIEGDAGASAVVDSPSMVIGGFGASSNTGTGFTLHGAAGGTARHLRIVNDLEPNNVAVLDLGSLSAPGTAVEFFAQGAAWTELPYRLTYQRYPTVGTQGPAWELLYGGIAGAPIAFTGRDHPYGYAQMLFQTGLWLGGRTFERRVVTTNGQPQFAAPPGSVAYEVLPQPGGVAEWCMCTDGVWRPSARVDA